MVGSAPLRASASATAKACMSFGWLAINTVGVRIDHSLGCGPSLS
jgi:hypothetical protein